MVFSKSYKISLSLSPQVLASHVSLFWNDIFANLDNSKCYLTLMVKARFDSKDMGFRSLANLRSVSYEDKDLFIDYICDNLGILSDSYTSNVVNKLVFTYMIHEGEVTDEERSLLALKEINSESFSPSYKFKGNILPVSMVPEDWGTILSKSELKNGDSLYLIKSNRKQTIKLEVLSGGIVNKGQIIGGPGSETGFSWQDVKQENGFVRTIGDKLSWHFVNGEVLSIKLIPCKPFKIAKKDKFVNNRFIC